MNKIFACMLMMVSISACSAPSSNNSNEITLYFARHGETLLNNFDHVQGWADAPLTAKGREVARYLGAGLQDIPFDRYYSGDLGRQRETLKIVLNQTGKSQVIPVELPGLRESYFGSFEGLPNEEMGDASARVLGYKDNQAMGKQLKSGKISIRQLQDAIAAADPAGQAENYQQVKQRTHAALGDIIKTANMQQDKNILIVTSGMTIMTMIYELTENKLQINPLANAAVVKITYKDGKYKVTEQGTLQYVNNGKMLLAK